MGKITTAERDAARDELRELLPPGSTAYMTVTHVSRSGMSRNIQVLAAKISEDHGGPFIVNVSHLVAKVTGRPVSRSGPIAVRVGGAGMDMTFHLAESISHALYGASDRVNRITL